MPIAECRIKKNIRMKLFSGIVDDFHLFLKITRANSHMAGFSHFQHHFP
jgi:hypothetical protein